MLGGPLYLWQVWFVSWGHRLNLQLYHSSVYYSKSIHNRISVGKIHRQSLWIPCAILLAVFCEGIHWAYLLGAGHTGTLYSLFSSVTIKILEGKQVACYKSYYLYKQSRYVNHPYQLKAKFSQKAKYQLKANLLARLHKI